MPDEIQERLDAISNSEPYIQSHEWTLVGHRFVPFGEQRCERCHNEELSQIFQAVNQKGEMMEVGSTCITRLCPDQQPAIRKSKKALAALAQAHLIEYRKEFQWTKNLDGFVAPFGKTVITVRRGVGGWQAEGVSLGQYFKTAAECRKAAEEKLFGS